MTGGNAPLKSVLSLKALNLTHLNSGDNLLQTGFWGSFKQQGGWRPTAFVWTWEGRDGRFLVLERSFTGGLSMAYVPYGPAFPQGMTPEEITGLLAGLAAALRSRLSRSCFMIRFDLMEQKAVGPELGKPLHKAPYRVQPPDSVILDLSLSRDALLGGMHKKTRYNIRLAQRKRVEIRRYTGADVPGVLPRWYRLYQDTARRDRIALHPESYYRRLFHHAAGAGKESDVELCLYMAEHDGEMLAGIIVSRCGGRSTYMYGASSSAKRELMPNHLLQWRAIEDARREGAREYDFYGVPATDDPGHPMHGLWRFKTGFGGKIVHYYGAWDYRYSPFFYSIYARAERFRARRVARRKNLPRPSTRV